MAACEDSGVMSCSFLVTTTVEQIVMAQQRSLSTLSTNFYLFELSSRRMVHHMVHGRIVPRSGGAEFQLKMKPIDLVRFLENFSLFLRNPSLGFHLLLFQNNIRVRRRFLNFSFFLCLHLRSLNFQFLSLELTPLHYFRDSSFRFENDCSDGRRSLNFSVLNDFSESPFALELHLRCPSLTLLVLFAHFES